MSATILPFPNVTEVDRRLRLRRFDDAIQRAAERLADTIERKLRDDNDPIARWLSDREDL